MKKKVEELFKAATLVQASYFLFLSASRKQLKQGGPRKRKGGKNA
jgi:hypothetical protein